MEEARERRQQQDRREDDRSPIGRDLIAALDRDGIEILFQPQFAAANGRLVGAEALARWQHPALGRLGAGALFAAAERTNQTGRLSRHIARAALAAGAEWPAALRLSLNVTAADLAAEEFVEIVRDALHESGFPPERLTLEITEQSLVADLDRSGGQLRRLADLGIRIALDDFGAGFCNFGYLKRLPLHYLKLDRSMVEDIDHDARDLAVLRGIMAMASALGLEVTAEGIERPSQLEAVIREGCTAWQGFLGAEPMPAAQFATVAAS